MTTPHANPHPKKQWKLVDISEPAPKPTTAWGARTTTAAKPKSAPQRFFRDKRPDMITDWFYTEWEDDVSPYLFSKSVCEGIMDYLATTDLFLVLSPSLFHKSIYTAVCAFAYNNFFEKNPAKIGAPRGLQKPPAKWTNQTLNIWHDFIHSRHLNADFFDGFWHKLPEGIWEAELSSIRNYLQSILPYYIKYNNDLLVENELIAENSEGELVDPAETDLLEDESHPYD